MYTVRQRKLIPILCQCLLFAKLIIQKHLIPIFIMGEFNIRILLIITLMSRVNLFFLLHVSHQLY